MANTQFLLQDKAQQAKRIAEKRRLIIQWLKSELYSSADILSAVIGLKGQGAHNTLKAMERDGLLRSEQLPTGSKMQQIYGLTPHAAALESDIALGNIVPYFESSKVSPWTLQHSLSIQKLRLQLEADGWQNWASDRDCRRLGQAEKWLKVPDSIAVSPDGQRVAIEVERSFKTLKRYPDIMAAYLQAIKQGQFAGVDYWCVGSVTATKMQEIFYSIKQIKIKGQLVDLQPHHYQQFNFFNFKE